MGVFESLIVGVDGSATAVAAFDWAVEHLRADGALHVVVADDVGPVDESILVAARSAVGEVRVHVAGGGAAEWLLTVADEHDGDAIVVGAHGSGRSRQVLGRVTTSLLHDAQRPVIVVHPDRSTSGPAAGHVVACVGYGEASDASAEWAAEHAAAVGLPLELLHVVRSRPMVPSDSPSDTIASYFGPGVVREWAQADLDALRAELERRHPALPMTTRLAVGSQLSSIEAATAGAELVVLGKRRARLFGKKRIGHRLHHLVVRLTAPVVVVPCTVDD